MTYYDWKKRYDALADRDRKIYDLARRAVNEMGFAAQYAAQGAERSQIKREENSNQAMKELWELLAGAAPVAEEGRGE